MLKCDIADGAKHYYYPVTNSRGDIMEIHNGPGQITAKYNYDAWGKLLSVTDANGNVLPKTHFAYKISVRYRGYEYDSETGLYYLQSRYYDPETGKFINADDAGFIGYSGESISFNAFAYCENNPVNDSDSDGLISIESIKKFFSNVISVLFKHLNEYIMKIVYIKNGVLSISATAFEVVINSIISSFCAGKIVNSTTRVIGYVLQRYQNRAPQKVVNILYYVIHNIENSGIVRMIAKIIAKRLVVRKKIVREGAVTTIVKDFLSGILLSNSVLLKKVNIICSSLSSIGGLLSTIISGFDGNWFDGYLRINIASFRRRYL